MKRFLIILFMPLLSMAQGGQGFMMNQPAAAPGFVIKANLDGLKDSTQVVLKNANDGKVLSIDKVKKGSFTFKGKLAEPAILQIGFNDRQEVIDLFISNDAVTVDGSVAQLNNLKIKGSATQTDYEAFKSEFNPYFEKLRGLVATINPEKDARKRDSMITEFNTYKANVLTASMKFVKSKPSSAVSSLVLFAVMPLFENPVEIESVYAQLQPGAHKSFFAHEIEKKLSESKIGMVGSQALDFTQKDVDGKPISLTSFRGKYVLVDFWASWCRPCRAENPNVVNAYQHFKDKNFTVLGVSLDQAKPNWLEAIKADGLAWTHVSDLQYWNNAVAQLYHIQSIPDNLLIDPTGKIIARGIRGEELQKKLKQLLQ